MFTQERESSDGLFVGITNDSVVSLFQNSEKPVENLFGNVSKTADYGLFGPRSSQYSAPNNSNKIDCIQQDHKSFTSEEVEKSLFSFRDSVVQTSMANFGLFSKSVQPFHTDKSALVDKGDPIDFDLPETSSSFSASHSVNPVSGSQPLHWPAVKLSHLPAGLNTSSFLQCHFQRFGVLKRIVCQLSMDVAYVVFESLASAQRAKRLGHEPHSKSAEGLPSTVVLSMARFRRQTPSGSKGTDLNLKTNFLGEQSLSSSTSSPLLFENQTVSSNILTNNSKEMIPSTNKCQLNETTSFPNIDSYMNPNKKSLQATTVDERLTILQLFYKIESERRSQITNKNLIISDGIDNVNSDESINHRPIQGTCLDMCPELERYLRAVHQRVSIFECLSSTVNSTASNWEMDHTRAVKDYQRSSADQPVPLPRELRPAHVLERTMAYLLASIADRPELETTRSLWKPWYEFMWTRTRAIRKDVRQQCLCCPKIVGIIEKIARFHIFCAARLIDQPVDSFDPRINSENLTQCLQTLKEMYTDLGNSHETGLNLEICPSEAEFRGYMILMKLNDQSEVNEAQKMPEHFRQSPPIQFAFSVYQALITNNYIRFFNLARKANCLNACLMHRYFVQIRGQALIRLWSAFAGHPKREVHYPVVSLTRQLAFENDEESKDFCERWGLKVLGSHVVFEKQTQPKPPELPWRERRSYHLIENKRLGIPLSTLFNGSSVHSSDATPLPVQSSFDTNGFYIGSHEIQPTLLEHIPDSVVTTVINSITITNTIMSNDQHKYHKPLVFTQPTSAPKLQTPQSSRKVLTNLTNDDYFLMSIIEELIVQFLPCREISNEILIHEDVSRKFATELIDEVVNDQLYRICEDIIMPIKQLSTEFVTNLIDLFVRVEVQNSACFMVALETVCQEVFHNLLTSAIKSIAFSSLSDALADSIYQYSLLRFCFTRFHYLIGKRQESINERILLDTMPTSVSADMHPLRLNYKRAEKLWSVFSRFRKNVLFEENRDERDLLQSFIRPRFSRSASKLDQQLTWTALQPSLQMKKYDLGIYTSIIIPSNCSKLLENFLMVTTYWLRKKLINFSLIPFQKLPSHTMANKISGLIIVAVTIETVEQILLSSPKINYLSILVILPQLNTTTHDSISNFNNVQENLNNQYGIQIHIIKLPLSNINYISPNPYWSIILQTGLNWLDTNLKSIETNINQTDLHNLIPYSNNNSDSDRNLIFFNVSEQITCYLDKKFLRPLSILSNGWNCWGLIDPSPRCIFEIYHSTLFCLINELSDQRLCDLLCSKLVFPQEILKPLYECSTTIESTDLQNEISMNKLLEKMINYHNSWDNLISMFNQLNLPETVHNWISLSIQNVEFEFEKRFKNVINLSSSSCWRPKPLPLLLPWLNLCYALIKNNLEQFCLTIPNQINSDHKIQQHLHNLIRQLDLNQIVEQLGHKFRNYNEPSLSRSVLYDLSFDMARRIRITNYLQSSKHNNNIANYGNNNQNNHYPTIVNNDNMNKLNLLSTKIQSMEFSMSEILDETKSKFTSENSPDSNH